MSCNTISDYLFDGCYSLERIPIPTTSMSSIGSHAFRSTHIEELDLSQSSNLLVIEEGAFMSCTFLQAVILPPQLAHLSAYTFQGCTNLTTVEFGDTAIINDSCFDGCYRLQKVTVPSSTLTTIGSYVFKDTGMEDIDLSEQSKLSSIGCGAFMNCVLLKRATLPMNLTVISESLFEAIWGYLGLSAPLRMDKKAGKVDVVLRVFAVILADRTADQP